MITCVLESAFRLSIEQRLKVVKRLYLKWQPDNNTEMVQIFYN